MIFLSFTKRKLSILQAISPTCTECMKEQSDSSTKYMARYETGRHQNVKQPQTSSELTLFSPLVSLKKKNLIILTEGKVKS